MGRDSWFLLGMCCGTITMLLLFINGKALAEYNDKQDMLKECEQILLQENAPRGKVCAITTTVVDISEINKQGEKK